ncbi:hypothetical protein O6H91_17G057100 [Diphasiastrum complanatum]|uniref:Uncharacterized protein n=2 Tax=Diphasiastrum complanatum TaxID=34168 RepID=A0ACC2B734_DIPCM|nr:hypothetical protein O6H91_17G057100 [Diphasiastrum complanatum]KAJ7525576.1 hypothetical protein O6H91_17G057100 [Diphasiastrum complanatum]
MPESLEFEEALQPCTGYSLDSPFYFDNCPIVYPQKQQKHLAYKETTGFDCDELNVPFGEESNESTGSKRKQTHFPDFKGTREGVSVRLVNRSKTSDECQNSSTPRLDSKDFQKHIQESNNLVSPWLDCEAMKTIGELKESIRLLAKLKEKEVQNVNSKPAGQHCLNSKKASQFAKKDDSRNTVKETLQQILHATTEQKAKGSPPVQGRREENGSFVGCRGLGTDSRKGKEPSRILLEDKKPVKHIFSPENSNQTRFYKGEIAPERRIDLKGDYDSCNQGHSNRMVSENNNGDKNKSTPNVIARLMGLDAMPERKGSIPPKLKKGPNSDDASLRKGRLFDKHQKETAKNQGIDTILQHQRQQAVQNLRSWAKNECSVGETIEQDKSNIQLRENGKTHTKALSKQQSVEAASQLEILNGRRHTKYHSYVSVPAARHSTDEIVRASQEMNGVGNATLQRAFEKHNLFQEHFANKKQPYQIPVSITSHGLDGETEGRIRQLRLQNVLEKHKSLKEIVEKMRLKGLLSSPLSEKMREIQHQKPIEEVPQMKLTDENVGSKTDDFRSLDLVVEKEAIPTKFKEAAIVLIKPISGIEESTFTVPARGPLLIGHSQSSSMVMPHKSGTVPARIVESKKISDKKLNENAESNSRIFKSHKFAPRKDGSQITEPKNSHRQQFEGLQLYEQQMEKGSHFKPSEELLPAPPIFDLLISMSKRQFSSKDSTTGGTDCVVLRDFRNAEKTIPEALQNSPLLGKLYGEFSAKKRGADCEELFLREINVQHKGVTPCVIKLPVICHKVKSVKSYDEEHGLDMQLTLTARKAKITIDSSRLHFIPDDATNLPFMKEVDKCSTITGVDSQTEAFFSRKELACQSAVQCSGGVLSSEKIAIDISGAALGKRAEDWESLRDQLPEKEGKYSRNRRDVSNCQTLDVSRLFLNDISEISYKLEEVDIAGVRGLARCRNSQRVDKNAQKTLMDAKAEKLKSSKAMKADVEEKTNMDREGTLEGHKSGTRSLDDKLQIKNASKGDPAKQLLDEHAAQWQPAQIVSADVEKHSPVSVLDIHFQEDEHVHATTSSYATKSQESPPQIPLASSRSRRSLDFSFQRHVDNVLQEVDAMQKLTGIVYTTFQTDVPSYLNSTDKKDQLQENLSVINSKNFQWQDDKIASIKDISKISGVAETSQLLTKAQTPATEENQQKGLTNEGEIHSYWKIDDASKIDKMGKSALHTAERRLHFECVNEIFVKRLLRFVDPHPWLSFSRPILPSPPCKQLVQQTWKELGELPCVPVEDACDMLHILLEHDLAQIPSQWSDLEADTVEVGLHLASLIFEDAVVEMICDLVFLTEARKVK